MAGELAASPVAPIAEVLASHTVTNVAQFKLLSGADFIAGCDFRLSGIITMLDTNRGLMVLQDASGAVALYCRINEREAQIGQLVTLEGNDCVPSFPGFPDFPHHPSEQWVLNSFEYPTNSNPYRLTRLRGYLCPPASGEYHFWIASDNSSELWLSGSADPVRAKRIAHIQRYGWVAPREWERLPTQRSEPVRLNAGERYYIEALLEQTSGDEHISVAWSGPGMTQSIVESRFLIPWRALEGLTNGILRECWTNYTAGDLAGLAGAREFQSALTAAKVRVTKVEPGKWPAPVRVRINQRLPEDGNYRWVRVEGTVGFVSADKDITVLELTDGPGRVQVWARHWNPGLSEKFRGKMIRVDGVCEGATDRNGLLTPGRIWASADCISRIETETLSSDVETLDPPPAESTPPSYPEVQDYFGMRGVVTFNDRLWDHNYLFVQKDAKVVQVDFENTAARTKLKVGTWLDIGGGLKPNNHAQIPVVIPLIAKELGWHSTPMPSAQPIRFPIPASQDGRWSEMEGVVRSVNSNETLTVVAKDGSINLWLGGTPPEERLRLVDAKLRARGVLTLSLSDTPVLLTPSLGFVDVEKFAPENPFDAPRTSIAALSSEMPYPSLHRVRIGGEVTWCNEQILFVQDNSGGIRVRNAGQNGFTVGDTVEVIGFSTAEDGKGTLAEAQVRRTSSTSRIEPRDLNLSEALFPEQDGMLVRVTATLLAVKTNGPNQVFELQEQRRIFTATLPKTHGLIQNAAPGSRIRLTGVCNHETSTASLTASKLPQSQLLSSINVLLRSPEDVRVVSGPPWWTWKQTTTLVGTLLTILAVTLLWVNLLQRRLKRQKAAQVAFSRQVLERLEDERRRIAVNLHDCLGQTLMVIKNHAMLAIQADSQESALQYRLDQISGATSQALEEVRQITHGLRPYQLDRLGLTQAIRASVSRASKACESNGIQFASRVENIDGLFDKDAEIHIYRIVQEAVTNAVKHSAATEAVVVIKKRPPILSLSVRDNGQGFDPAAPNPRSNGLGYGLSGIAERSRILGAVVTIDSHPGGGTCLTVELPLPVQQICAGT